MSFENSCQEKVSKVENDNKETQRRLNNKADAKPVLILEQIVRNMYDFMFEGDKEVMLSKNQLGGQSCASCDKDMQKFRTPTEKYHPWNQLPQREGQVDKPRSRKRKIFLSMQTNKK